MNYDQVATNTIVYSQTPHLGPFYSGPFYNRTRKVWEVLVFLLFSQLKLVRGSMFHCIMTYRYYKDKHFSMQKQFSNRKILELKAINF